MKRLLIISAVLACAGFGLWSMFVASRYQALCELSYWSATSAELRLCDERQTELQGR